MSKFEELKDEEKVITEVESSDPVLGLNFQDLTPELAQSLGLSKDKGVLISDVEVDSVGAEAGLRRGDLVMEVDSKVPASAAELRTLLSKLKANSPVLLLIKRGDSTIFLTLKSE